MMLHNIVVGHADPIKPVNDAEFICHTCMLSMKKNEGVKSHLSGHGHQNKMETITNYAWWSKM